MKIQVMVPCYENIYPDTMKCIWDIGRNATGFYEVDFDFVRGYSVDMARNLCVHRAKEEQADYMLFVDNDVTFAPDNLDMLVEHELPVVMGYYDHRPQDPGDDKPRTNLCKLGQANYIEQVTKEEMEDARLDGYDLVQVKGGGLGFTLIDMDVFKVLSYPYFAFMSYSTGGSLSEDLCFCEKCARAGIDIYADSRCYCGHMFREIRGGLM